MIRSLLRGPGPRVHETISGAWLREVAKICEGIYLLRLENAAFGILIVHLDSNLLRGIVTNFNIVFLQEHG